MEQRKVRYAQLRKTTYHFNMPIPPTIRSLYPDQPTGIYRGTMKTSDPDEAERMVRKQKTMFDEQQKQAQRRADQERIASLLDPADLHLIEEIGGIQNVVPTIIELRRQAAFTLAGRGAEFPQDDEIEGGTDAVWADLGKHGDVQWKKPVPPARVAGGGEYADIDPHTLRMARDMDEQDVQRRLDALSAESRRLRRIADQMQQEVPEAPEGYDEGLVGIRELAEAMLDAKDSTVDTRQKVTKTVRRWIELHGDLPIEKWERKHLDKFDEVLIGLPSTKRPDVNGLPLRKAVEAGSKESLPTIGTKTRTDYSDYMKLLSKYAVDRAGLLTVDPFTGFQPRRIKESYSEKKKAKRVSYDPAQVGLILDHCASTFDRKVIDHWLPLLAAHTGARREELGQLTVNDLRLVGNIHVMDITDLDPLQKLKNANSLRSVPLPDAVLNAGFIDYVQERRAAGAHMLFQEKFRIYRPVRDVILDLRPDNRGKLTERYGKRFADQVREPLGLTAPGMVFHSLRHSWTDAARRARIDSDLRRMIAGRMDGEDVTEAGYGSDELLAEKLDALEAVAKVLRA